MSIQQCFGYIATDLICYICQRLLIESIDNYMHAGNGMCSSIDLGESDL